MLLELTEYCLSVALFLPKAVFDSLIYLLRVQIPGQPQHDQDSRITISPCSSSLLDEVTHGPREAVQDYESHIWNVDPHTNGARATNDSFCASCKILNELLL